MPATAAALAAGDITVAHARRLATLCAPDTAAAFTEAETFLVGQARSLRWADFTKACSYWLRHARPHDPDPDKTDRQHRKVSLHDGLRGTGLLSGELTPTAKTEIRTELERLEHIMFETDWAAAKALHGHDTTIAHLTRTPAQRRHDALVEMAHRSATTPANGKRPRPLLSVLVGEDAFRHVLELADGTLISPATVADLLDDAVIERIVFDGPSRVLDLGRQRTFTGAARRAVQAVHRTCDGPGCHTPADRCEIDHTLPYTNGGLTTPDNGTPKCRAPPPPTHRPLHPHPPATRPPTHPPTTHRPPRTHPSPHPRPHAPRPHLGRPRRRLRLPLLTGHVESRGLVGLGLTVLVLPFDGRDVAEARVKPRVVVGVDSPAAAGTRDRAPAGIVVRTLAGLCTPTTPWTRISRSTRSWFTVRPRRASSVVARGAP